MGLAVEVLNQQGRAVGEVTLSDAVFGVEPNESVVHQVVTAQLAARRAGTHNTKTRAEVAGGGAKPWRQKGTGRARHGSSRSPQWRGGGVAHGPKPRSHRQRTPKKMKRLALVSALSDRVRASRVIVVDRWDFPVPRTKQAAEALESIGVSGKALLVLGDSDITAWKSFRNLDKVHCLRSSELNTHDVIKSDVVVFTSATLPEGDSSGVEGEQDVEVDAVVEGGQDA